MKYIVIKPFNDISGFKSPGESIELSDNRAAKLRSHGLIGGKYIEPIVEIKQEDPKQEDPKEVKKPSKKVK